MGVGMSTRQAGGNNIKWRILNGCNWWSNAVDSACV